MPPDVAVGVLEGAGIGFDLEADLRAVDAPVSAISSEHFRPKDDAAFAAAGITNVTMADTGHYLMLERPQEFDEHLARGHRASRRVAAGAAHHRRRRDTARRTR